MLDKGKKKGITSFPTSLFLRDFRIFSHVVNIFDTVWYKEFPLDAYIMDLEALSDKSTFCTLSQ